MEIIKGDQGTPEWHQQRLGSIGGASIKNVMAKGKGKSRLSLMYQLASEIITGEPADTFTNATMERGTQLEPKARAAFSFVCDEDVKEVSLIKGDIERTHCSPDGLVGKNAILELKCPLAHTQARYLDEDRMPTDYIKQIQWNMYISQRTHCHFFSYHPQMHPFHVIELQNNALIADMIVGAQTFLEELKALVVKIS